MKLLTERVAKWLCDSAGISGADELARAFQAAWIEHVQAATTINVDDDVPDDLPEVTLPERRLPVNWKHPLVGGTTEAGDQETV